MSIGREQGVGDRLASSGLLRSPRRCRTLENGALLAIGPVDGTFSVMQPTVMPVQAHEHPEPVRIGAFVFRTLSSLIAPPLHHTEEEKEAGVSTSFFQVHHHAATLPSHQWRRTSSVAGPGTHAHNPQPWNQSMGEPSASSGKNRQRLPGTQSKQEGGTFSKGRNYSNIELKMRKNAWCEANRTGSPFYSLFSCRFPPCTARCACFSERPKVLPIQGNRAVTRDEIGRQVDIDRLRMQGSWFTH